MSGENEDSLDIVGVGCMDEMDRTLLSALKEDGRMSFRELGQKMNVSAQTVSDRVDKLRERGVIKGFTVVVDEEKAGYAVDFTVELDVELPKMKDILRELALYRELYQVNVITGEHDILALGVARDIRHLYEIIEEKISNIDGIRATKTSISLKTVKDIPKCII